MSEPRIAVHLAQNGTRPVDLIEEVDGQPVFPPPAEGNSLPGPCLRVLTSPHPVGCGSGFGVCPGQQRDGSCLAELVADLNARGVKWAFEVDKDGYWVLKG